MPLNQITMEEFSCAMVDSCPPYFSENELYEMFMENFRRHYDTNRAPLGLYFHTLWFKDKKNRRAFRKFLNEMVSHPHIWSSVSYSYNTEQHTRNYVLKPLINDLQVSRQDVYIVSNWEVIQWMQQPTKQSQMDSFLPWKNCPDVIPPEKMACNIPR